jgi:hypothetical protein
MTREDEGRDWPCSMLSGLRREQLCEIGAIERVVLAIRTIRRKCRIAVLTYSSFQYIIRLLNTNVDGKQKVMYALTKIKGVGRRYSNLVCKKADVDLGKRAGDLTSEELERIVTIIQNPLQCMLHQR